MNEVRAFIQENFPALAEAVIGLVRPCVCTMPPKQADESIWQGASQFGGRPDVPVGFAWPMTADGRAGSWPKSACKTSTGTTRVSRCRPTDCSPSSITTLGDRPGLNRECTSSVSSHWSGSRLFQTRATRPASPSDTLHRDPWSSIRDTACPTKSRLSDGTSLRSSAKRSMNAPPGGIHQFFGLPQYRTPPPGQQLRASLGEGEDRYLYYVPEPRGGSLDLSKVNVVYECT